MYSRKRAKLPDNITLDWILSKVTEYDIYANIQVNLKQV